MQMEVIRIATASFFHKTLGKVGVNTSSII